MKKFTPVVKVKGFATQQSKRLSEKTLKKTQVVSIFLAEVASVFIFISVLIKETFSRDFEFREFLRQCFQVGYKSLPLITVTGAIMGLVLTIQSRPVLVDFGAVSLLPGMVTVSIIREMGPVITALICAGKIGSGMGAELGSMKVTEQIEAMEVSSINPMRFLVVTRVLAATLMIPLLIFICRCPRYFRRLGRCQHKRECKLCSVFFAGVCLCWFRGLPACLCKIVFFRCGNRVGRMLSGL